MASGTEAAIGSPSNPGRGTVRSWLFKACFDLWHAYCSSETQAQIGWAVVHDLWSRSIHFRGRLPSDDSLGARLLIRSRGEALKVALSTPATTLCFTGDIRLKSGSMSPWQRRTS